ncbi:MAG: 1,4-dihydroxy-2-naphthoate octaprenyltransferase [Bacteroidetes bacterium]|nr:1,4-dihydroxy-2-naphthoate octaprenyltransferase [Bacteroidota bacterium]
MAAVKHWVGAARLRTLPLAIAGLVLGNCIASYQNSFSWSVCILSILTAFFLQVLSNYANDYGDYAHGVDNDKRIGPTRAVQSGEISQEAMKKAIVFVALLALLSGLALLWFSREQVNLIKLGIMLTLGLLSIWAAIKYTASKNPYGYKGYGDIAVLIFFGLIAVLGVLYLQTGGIELSWFAPAIAFGLLSVGVLNLNNMRDIENDFISGKITIAVRLGLKNARFYHYGLIVTAILLFVFFANSIYQAWWQYLFLTPLALLIIHLHKVSNRTNYKEFNPLLKELALSSAFIAISVGLSLNIG